MYYVTVQITLHILEFARKERNLPCDIVHITTKWVFRLTLDYAIAAIQTSRYVCLWAGMLNIGNGYSHCSLPSNPVLLCIYCPFF